MSKPIKRFFLWCGAALLLLILCDVYATIDTQSAIGVARFRWCYRVSASKAQWLHTYRSEIWNHGGGYIPPQVQKFLCARLENPTDAQETQAVADFYASQAFGREYGLLDKLSDTAKIRMIDALFLHLPKKPLRSRLRSLFLIEEVRRGEMIGKGYFYVVDYPQFSHYLQVYPAQHKGHEGEAVFQRVLIDWWHSSLSSAEKLRQDPLKTAGMKIDGY